MKLVLHKIPQQDDHTSTFYFNGDFIIKKSIAGTGIQIHKLLTHVFFLTVVAILQSTLGTRATACLDNENITKS